VNLASLPKQLSAGELMGYVPGAFTGAVGHRAGRFASANGGTLILDEITKSTRVVQHLLLDLMDRAPHTHLGSDREVSLNLRIVALTSTPLDIALRSKALIPDLFERLKPFVVEIAPLSARPVDIEVLVQEMVRTHSRSFGYQTPPLVDACVLQLLSRRQLTGNHRELEGLVQRLLVNGEGTSLLTPRHLPAETKTPESRSIRAKRKQYAADQESGDGPQFATVKDEASYYEVSLATIHRWRGDSKHLGTSSDSSVAIASRD
jgi:DNA-binding NtrC family response regulator